MRAGSLASLYPLSSAHPEGASSHPQAATLEFRNVSKTYEGSDTPAIEDLSFEVPAGEICVLVGPSGCGKTTAMRMVNRMLEITSGDILLDGASVRERRPADLRREIGYAIQQIGLFPHLTIADNIATVPRLLGWARERIRARVDELIELVGLDPAEMRERYPVQLSGGQRQRVGVARALAADPPLMLMDEPFGADRPDQPRAPAERVPAPAGSGCARRSSSSPTTSTRRSRSATASRCSRPGGVLAQYATPAELLMQPADAFVEDFVGADRALKRLALHRVRATSRCDPVATTACRSRSYATTPAARWPGSARRRAPSGRAPCARTSRCATRSATCCGAPSSYGPVIDGDGRVLGVLSIDVIHELLEREADGGPR